MHIWCAVTGPDLVVPRYIMPSDVDFVTSLHRHVRQRTEQLDNWAAVEAVRAAHTLLEQRLADLESAQRSDGGFLAAGMAEG